MTKTAAEVEEEVVSQRGQLDRTVEALKDKMTPGQLFDEASHAMGGAGQQVLTKFLEQAKENPMPLAVMGLGLAWLMSSSTKTAAGGPYANSAATYPAASTGRPGGAASDMPHTSGVGGAAKVVGEAVSGMASAAGAMAASASHTVSELAVGAGHSISDAGASAGQTSQDIAHGVSAAAGAAADKAAVYGQRAQQGALDLLQREPLVIGALGLFVGFALGAALPATEAEDRLLGPTHDRMFEAGKGIADDVVSHAGEAADAVLGKLQSQIGDANVPAAIHDVMDAAKGSLRQEG